MWRILAPLESNARISNTELGKQIGLSLPAVTARIKRLEEQGVIEGYAARINSGVVGRGIAAIVRIRTTHAQIKHYLSFFEAMPEIVKTHRLTGEDCFMVRIVVEDTAQLEVAIDTLARLGPVTTAVVLANCPPKAIRGPSLRPATMWEFDFLPGSLAEIQRGPRQVMSWQTLDSRVRQSSDA